MTGAGMGGVINGGGWATDGVAASRASTATQPIQPFTARSILN